MVLLCREEVVIKHIVPYITVLNTFELLCLHISYSTTNGLHSTGLPLYKEIS